MCGYFYFRNQCRDFKYDLRAIGVNIGKHIVKNIKN